MHILHGDLISLSLLGVLQVIVHGVNCFNTMGAGIALQIKHFFPEAYEADQKTLRGSKQKLGNIGIVVSKKENQEIVIINAYTQYNYGRNRIYVDYDAVDSCFKRIRNLYYGKDLAIGYPRIGCGLAGGNWERVSSIIDKNLQGMNHTLVIK